MSETQNNTVVAAFLTATGNAGLTKTKRVEIGGSSAEIDFGKFLKAATQVNDSKERYSQAEKPDHREPGRASTTPEPSFKTNQALANPKPVTQGNQGTDDGKKTEELKTPGSDHAVNTSDSKVTASEEPEVGTHTDEENRLPEELQAQLVVLMNQLNQLMAFLNSQVSGNTGAIDSTGLNGVDAANLQSVLNQLQLMLNSQNQTASSQNSNSTVILAGVNPLTNGNQSTNAAAMDLLNQITALMKGQSLNDSQSFQGLLGKTAASLSSLINQGSKTQTAQTVQAGFLQPVSELNGISEKTGTSSESVILETGIGEAEVAADSSHPQTLNSLAELAKGAFDEGKPLNLAIIQTQLAVGESADQSGANGALGPIQNQNSPLVNQSQQPASQETNSVNRDQLFSQLVERAKFMFANDRSEMEVSLKPDHLGKLQLKVTIENQVVTARFVAESLQVKEIIETNLNQLREQLRQNGMQVDSLVVTVGNQMNPQNFNQTGNDQNGSNHLGGQSQGYNPFNEENEEAPVTSPQTVRETVIDLIA